MGCLGLSLRSRRKRTSSESNAKKPGISDLGPPQDNMSPLAPPAPSRLRYDPEFWKAIEPFASQQQPPAKNVSELRSALDKILRAVFRLQPTPESIQQTRFTVTSADGTAVSLVRFATAAQAAPGREPGPAVLFTHGGGMVCGSVDIFAPEIARHADAAAVPFWAVDYRLAPEHPAPAALDDCYAALAFLSAHGPRHGVDPARLALVGDSAGGGLAAGTALLARDRRLHPPVAKQVLVYPMLDDRTTVAAAARPADWALRPFLTWSEADNVLAWDAYLGPARRGSDRPGDVSAYAAPARAESLAGLPPTYIDVGGLDLFRDEAVAYAARLAREDVEVEFHLWPGVPHGFDGQIGTTVARTAMATRRRAMGSGY